LEYRFKDHKKTFQVKADLAAKGQLEFERALLKVSRWLQKTTGQSNLCYAGGCALNVLANSKIQLKSRFKNLYIPPAPHDGGTSIGCALYGIDKILKKRSFFYWKSDYLGPLPGDWKIDTEPSKYPNLKVDAPADLVRTCVEAIMAGHAIALFQPKSEFGPRALGNRSIISDPRYSITKFWINQMIKGREWYRPIAPVVLEKNTSTYFDFKKKSDFMQYSVRVKKQYRSLLRAVVHVDGSARIQTLSKKHNDFLYKLLLDFKRLTNIGILSNTSFNLCDEPIVETVEEALSSFSRSCLYYLVMPPYIIYKETVPDNPLQLSQIKLNV